MKRLYVEAIGICIGSGLILAAANVLLPVVLTPVFAFALGVVAFSRVFMAPGQLSLKRDLLMFGVIVGALATARYVSELTCSLSLAVEAKCEERYLRAAGFVSMIGAFLPTAFFWSWVRIRLLRDQIADRRRQ